MQQLSEQDASFLYLESDHAPMHNGGLYLFDASARPTEFDFMELKEFVASRLHRGEFFRKRLVEVPLKLDHPYWVDDPEFHLERHLFHICYTQAHSLADLTQLASQVLSTPLRRDRPLWEITFVDDLHNIEGLNERHFALIVKIHQCAIDPMSGTDVLSVLLDFTAEEQAIPAPKHWRANPVPTTLRLLGNAYNNALTTPFRLANMAKDTVSATFYSLLLQRLNNLNLPPTLFSAPITDINTCISEKRSLDYLEVPLDQIKHLKSRIGHGVTMNDVIMGVCAEAIMMYLSDHKQTPSSSLIAMSPISVRSKNIKSPAGNQMAAMMISLATDEQHPGWRVLRIHENAIVSKYYNQAIAASFLTRTVPSSMVGLAARIYTEFQLAQRHKPLFNLPLINIPGPQKPLYMNGCELVRQVGSSPIFDGIGVSIVAISYNGQVTFSITSCPSNVCDAKEITTYLARALQKIEAESETLAGEEPPAYFPVSKASPSLMEIGSMVIEDIFALFNNLFSFRKTSGRKNENHSEKTD